VWLVVAASCVASVVLLTVTESAGSDDPSTSWPSVVTAFIAFQSFATVGALIASRQSWNPIGWLFLSAAALCQWANLVGAYSTLADQRGWPGVVWPNVLFAATWGSGVLLVALFGLQLFPTGRPLSGHWRSLVWASAAVLPSAAVALSLEPGQVDGAPDGHDNPIGVPGMDVVAGALWLCLVGLVVASIASLVVRFRRARGVERQQLEVVAATVAFVFAVLLAVSVVSSLTGALDFLGTSSDVIWLLMLSLIPASVGVAMLRYRLYEIDRVISRTLVYGALTVILGAAYVGLVLLGQWVFASFAGGGDLAIAASTLAVAALFLPVRSRVQRFVDRRFYRRRYDAQRTLEAFGARLRDDVELDAVVVELRRAVGETMQPAHVSVWRGGAAR
jgi:hypothetical protein